jgi:hypothetical protein
MRLLFFAITPFILFGCSGYENDGKNVYYKSANEAVGFIKFKVDADAKTFKVLTDRSYAKDAMHAFYEGKSVLGADAQSFETIGNSYARDKFRGYYYGDSIKSSHGTTFWWIDEYYSTDSFDVFFETYPLHVCSVKQFHIVYENPGFPWSTDGCFYYCGAYKIPSDDYEHVTIFKKSHGFAKDKNWVYFFDHKLNYDDSGRKIIDTIDAASFTVNKFSGCKDKFGCINEYHGRENCK